MPSCPRAHSCKVWGTALGKGIRLLRCIGPNHHGKLEKSIIWQVCGGGDVTLSSSDMLMRIIRHSPMVAQLHRDLMMTTTTGRVREMEIEDTGSPRRPTNLYLRVSECVSENKRPDVRRIFGRGRDTPNKRVTWPILLSKT
jgi:hypothetical protein